MGLKVPEKALHIRRTRTRRLNTNRYFHRMNHENETDEEFKARVASRLDLSLDEVEALFEEEIKRRATYVARVRSLEWLCVPVVSTKYTKELEKKNEKSRDLEIPKLDLVLENPYHDQYVDNNRLWGTVYYCKNKSDYKHVERMSVCETKHGLVYPDQVWSKPTVFPKFVLAMYMEFHEGRYKAWGLGDIEPTVEEIEKYIQVILFLNMKDFHKSTFNATTGYKLMYFSLPPSAKILLSKFLKKYMED